jgi:hypothetical protein
MSDVHYLSSPQEITLKFDKQNLVHLAFGAQRDNAAPGLVEVRRGVLA